MMEIESPEPWRDLKSTTKNVNQVMAAAGFVASIFDCAQGTAENQRLGNEVEMRHIAFRFFFSNNSGAQHAATPNAVIARIMVLIDHQTNGSTPAVTDILDAASVNAFTNDTNQLRFEVLYDTAQNMHLEGQTCTAVVPAVAANYSLGVAYSPHREIHLNLQRRISYKGTAATLANIATGSFLICGLSDTGDASVLSTFKCWYDD